jgi:hypothetical protein
VKLGLIEDSAANRAGHGNRPAGVPPAPNRPTRPIPSETATPRPAPPRPAELTEEEKDNLPF